MKGHLLGRKFVGAMKPDSICFAQFNILADSLSDAFPLVEKKFLTWGHRFPLLLSEILYFVEAGSIVCCEEVEHFEQFEDALRGVAWAFFEPKTGGKDGCALFVPYVVVFCCCFFDFCFLW
jgi:mRNA deadenylase 3'-5' endonuclease subunit Ccr4